MLAGGLPDGRLRRLTTHVRWPDRSARPYTNGMWSDTWHDHGELDLYWSFNTGINYLATMDDKTSGRA